jgi:tetratricopeptide (TPR) repeat protein
MPTAVWVAERSYAMRVMAECHQKLKNDHAAEMWLHKAAAEHPMAREGWVALSELMYSQSRWEECLAYASRALRIHHRMNDYTCEPSAYGAKPHDLAAIAAWRMGLKDVAIEQGKLALQFAPNDKRLLDNLSWYQGDK